MASIQEREWKKPDGKTGKGYQVRWLDTSRSTSEGKPKQGSKTFKLLRDAQAHKRKVESEIENGTFVSTVMTVRQVCEQFALQTDARFTDGRIGKARHVFISATIKNKILPALGARRIADLTGPMVEDVYRNMIKIGGVSPQTARSHLIVLHMVEEFARKRKWLSATPVEDALKEVRGLPRPKIRTFGVDEMRRLIDALQVRRTRARLRPYRIMRCMVLLAAVSGLRFGEIAALQVRALDFQRQLILVRHNVTAWKEVKGPKSEAGHRDVPMPSILAAELRSYLIEEGSPDGDAFLFYSSKGNPMANRTFHRFLWRPLLVAAGLKDEGKRYHFHALRHFTASWMIDNGWTVPEVQKALGHASFDTTLQTYAHPLHSDDRRVENAERITRLLLPSPPPTSHVIPMTEKA